jgi:pantoate--beta-alanine ligase
MTMGALHAGHVRLIEVARERADSVLVTVFVNPLQFGVGEDLEKYPRVLAADLALCAEHGVDLVFAPAVEDMYPPGQSVRRHQAGELGQHLEGAIRPGHFDGMLTVVGLLLDLTRPDLAVFGEKDAQQLALIRRLVAMEGYPVTIVGVPTVREPDGLALSSRNRYLDDSGRRSALALSRALRAGTAAAAGGAAAALDAARAVLAAEPGVQLDYVVVLDDATWQPAETDTRNARILVAGRVGTTRLIDNVPVVLGSD